MSKAKKNDKKAEKSDKKELNKLLYCGLSEPGQKHLIMQPVSLKCLDYACRDCVANADDNELTCTNCGQTFLKSDIDLNDECMIGNNLIKDNVIELHHETLKEFEDLKDDYNHSLDINKQLELQGEIAKNDVKKRIQELKAELDRLENAFDDDIEKSKENLKKANSQMTVPQYEEFVAKVNLRIEKLKKDITVKDNPTPETYTAYQMTLRKMRSTIESNSFIKPQIKFQASSRTVEKSLLGSIGTQIAKSDAKIADINNRIKSGKYRVVEIEAEPWDVCVLPNGYLLVADLSDNLLCLYDEKFRLKETIETLNQEDIYPIGLTTNDVDSIYIVNHANEKVFKTNLQFEVQATFGSHGVALNQFLHPRGICYYKNFVYVCDCGAKRIQKLTADTLKYKGTFALGFSPSRIKIYNEIAFVGGGLNNRTAYFYDIDTFQLRFAYERFQGCGLIGLVNSSFYEYNCKRIYCYSDRGEVIDEMKTSFGNHLNDYNYDSGIVVFRNKLILYNYKGRKFVLV